MTGKPKTVQLVHAETGAKTETTPEFEAMFRSQGWVTPAEAKEPAGD